MTPLLNALLSGLANLFAFVYALLVFIREQTRIATASGGFLDLIGYDFLGPTFLRANGQSDASFRALIIASILRKRCTRASVSAILTQLTGNAPLIFEPGNIRDTGAYGGPLLAYNTIGAYGSLALPFQSFVTAYRQTGGGLANLAGYGVSTGAYTTPSQLEYISLAEIEDFLTDDDLYAAVNSVRPAATTIWIRILNAPPGAVTGGVVTVGGVGTDDALTLPDGDAIDLPSGDEILA